MVRMPGVAAKVPNGFLAKLRPCHGNNASVENIANTRKSRSTMAKNIPTNSNHTSKPSVNKEGVFTEGEEVVVVRKGSIYLGKKGTVSRFCKDPSSEWLYVHLDGDRERRMKKSSISRVGQIPVEVTTKATESPKSVMEESDDTSGYGRRVLTLLECVHEMREEHNGKDVALDKKLYEIEKMIIGLSLR